MRGLPGVRIGSVAMALAHSGIGGGAKLLAQTPTCPTQFSGYNIFYGDADIAVGGSHVLIVDHDYLRVFDKCGLALQFSAPLYTGVLPNGLVLTGTADPLPPNEPGMFLNAIPAGSAGNGPNDAIDPEVHYDPLTGRFYAMMHKANEDPGTPEHCYIGVSGVENARVWPRLIQVSCTLSCNPQNTLTLFDRGTIAIDQSDVWFSAWVEDPSGICGNNPFLNRSYALGRSDKADLIGPGSAPGATWINVKEWDDTQPNLARRLTHNDGAPQYAVGGGFPAFGIPVGSTTVIALYTVKYAGGQVLQPDRIDVSFTQGWNHPLPGSISQPPGNPPGAPIGIGVFQSFIWSAVYRNGSIWCANVVSSPLAPNRCWIRWYQIAMNGWHGGPTNVPSIIQRGEIDPGDGMSAWVPSVSVTCDNTFAVTYNVVGPNAGQYVAVRSSYRCASDMPNTLRAPITLYQHNSLLAINMPSAGSTDFSGTMVDPVINGRFWTHHGLVTFPGQTLSKVTRFDTSCGADLNCDGAANMADSAMFVNAFAAGEPNADFVPDEQATTDDVILFGELAIPK